MEKYFILTIVFLVGVVSCGAALTTFGKSSHYQTTTEQPLTSDVTTEPINKTYHLQTTFTATWHRASHHCIHKKMRLGSVFSPSELNQLIKQIRESGYTDSFWIALTNLGSLNFYWFGYDKPVTSWQKMQVVESAGTPQHCIVISPFEHIAYWPTEDCGKQLHFVCENDDISSVDKFN